MHQGAAFLDDFDPAHPVRQRLGEILLYKAFFTDPARETLHGQRAALDVRQHGVGHLAVVVDQLPLGDAFSAVREQDAIRMGDLDLNARHQGVSRTTSPGSLSVRSPWYRGCRSLPSRVHSVNPIWATNSGRTQRAPFSRTSPRVNGGASCSMGDSRSCRLCSVASSKPVPTLPA